MTLPDRDDGDRDAIEPRKKRSRAYQVSLEFATADEPGARALMQRLPGVAYTSGVDMRGVVARRANERRADRDPGPQLVSLRRLVQGREDGRR
jgi:hypothetical protein